MALQFMSSSPNSIVVIHSFDRVPGSGNSESHTVRGDMWAVEEAKMGGQDGRL